jgi:seryl-tRNA synthetase
MLDIQFIRDHPDQVKQSTKNKGYDPKIVDEVLALDRQRRELIGKIENLRAERNQLTKNDIVKGKKIKTELKKLEPQLKEAEEKYLGKLNQVPNLCSTKAPLGKSEKDNKVVKTWGEPKKFNFPAKDHLQLGKDLNILDFTAGAKAAGAQFYYWYGAGARLELALIQYAFDVLEKEGFRPVITPDLVKSRFYLGTGYIPKGKEAQTYEIKDEDLGLIATAEVTLAARWADEIIPADKLPLKYIGYSHCFRKEEGAYGKYSKGLYRVHEFTKAEMFIYCVPEESDRWHEYLLSLEEKIYQDLGLPYRAVEMCTGDLGAMAARKFDIEAWMPGRKDYGEVTSTSNCTDYQARNLNIKFRQGGQTNFVHMLNGTAIATSRTPLAILENYQTADGHVTIPEVLQPYVHQKII